MMHSEATAVAGAAASATSSHLPNRRQRLRAFMRLKTQRRMLIVTLTVLAMLCATLLASMVQDHSRQRAITLGSGVAGVEAASISDLWASVASGAAPTPSPTPSESAMASGEASYYGGGELRGERTASGETFNPEIFTAAHRTLPMGSRVRVTNPRTGSSVIVRINDRGPFHRERVIDLSLAAAPKIDLIRTGTSRVHLALIV